MGRECFTSKWKWGDKCKLGKWSRVRFCGCGCAYRWVGVKQKYRKTLEFSLTCSYWWFPLIQKLNSSTGQNNTLVLWPWNAHKSTHKYKQQRHAEFTYQSYHNSLYYFWTDHREIGERNADHRYHRALFMAAANYHSPERKSASKASPASK